MNVHTNIPLKNYTTMKLGGPARFMSEAHTPDDVASICASAQTQNLPVFILGGGSNVVIGDAGFNGLVLRNRIPGFETVQDTASQVDIRIGAGENWDEVVRRSVEMNLSGIEAMSAIPGTAGAAPVQNVGAYGQEVADTLISVEAYDQQDGKFVVLSNEDCGFSYRHSIFRGESSGRYVITALTLRLFKAAPQPPFYAALQNYFDTHSITMYTPQVIRDAVTEIRKDKLPDPTQTPNSGSFFKNVIVEDWQLNEIRNEYPDVPSFDMPGGGSKVPSGWLIEQAGYKGKSLHGMKVHDKNALVLINQSAQSYADLAAAREEIRGAVRDKFRLNLEQEPLEI